MCVDGVAFELSILCCLRGTRLRLFLFSLFPVLGLVRLVFVCRICAATDFVFGTDKLHHGRATPILIDDLGECLWASVSNLIQTLDIIHCFVSLEYQKQSNGGARVYVAQNKTKTSE